MTAAAEAAAVKLRAPVKKAILAALGERDEGADVCRDKDGNPEPDKDLRDYENVPLGEDVDAYFERQVRPHVPEAWVNAGVRDQKDGLVGMVGWESNFHRAVDTSRPPRPREERAAGREWC